MKIADAEKLALELIEEHLPGKNWRFRFDRQVVGLVVATIP